MPSARELLSPGGPFARMPGYELRPGQLQMAEAVEHALDTDGVLLCEAGTGTGKTLAYLLPAMATGMRVVVSTATKALQEQILGKDLPLIQQTLGIEARARLVKGLGNYLCLRRFAELEMSSDLGSKEVRRALPLVRRWSEHTETGDIAELGELPESHPIWREVTSSSDTRIGARCRFFHDCHITRNKRAAEEARLLIVNHHLFFADLAIRGDHPGGALPPYDAVILDEAHKIEDVATSFFGARVSSSAVDRLVTETARTLRAAGLHEEKLCERVRSLAAQFFALVNLHAGHEARRSLHADMWHGTLLDAYHTLDDALEALEQHATTRAESEAVSQ
ncbi:MAG TPA: ATP-dependent DNA helicase, partial [Polyangiaceae bacterium]|nr:ATP-dependent DNA helicase [Polyangiaceae bacterium]